ncbi:KAP family P-loop NTPase fold protein [Pseudomonas sp. RA_15y_Pfl2_54]|uniref:KAP family P-loop NTPase fold protein n=1 Tax=Pseudomonas sp. RA_15y_Pfl2_54 TaxID=3088704 RepID=UPI0030DB2685
MDEDFGVWADDLMGRKTSAEFLTRYLLANDHVKVLNVNSAWGAGKSFFLERWAKELNSKHVCVYFNAWESDYSSEPLVALMAALEQQLVDSSSAEATEIGRTAINTVSKLIKKGTPLVVRGLFMKFTGVNFNDLIGEGGDDAAGKLVEDLVAEHASAEKNVEEFKEALRERFLQARENEGKNTPVFIFIDELDRCRPTYAIELLERIKHFFDMDDCKFIIASDSKQLAHSIKVVYGQSFGSSQYLRRFFDAEFSLDNRNIFKFVQSVLPAIDSYLVGINVQGRTVITHGKYNSERTVSANGSTFCSDSMEFDENTLLTVALCKIFNVQLREILNYVRQIKAASDFMDGSVHFFCLAILIFARAQGSDFYLELLSGDESALRKHCPLGAALTVHMNTELVTINDLLFFHVSIMRGVELRFEDTTPMWKKRVYSDYTEKPKLRKYKPVVDLAHQLS